MGRISKLIEDNDQSAILYLKILWKQGKLTDAKSFLELNEHRLFQLVLSDGSPNQIAKNLALVFNIGCSSIPKLLLEMNSLPVQKLNELFKQLIAIDKQFKYQPVSSTSVITLAEFVNMLSCDISTNDEMLKILNLADDFLTRDESSSKLSFEDQQLLRENIFEKLSRFEFNNEMLSFVHKNFSKVQTKSFGVMKKVLAKLNNDETTKIFQHSIKILNESTRRILAVNSQSPPLCGSIAERLSADELQNDTDQIIYHLKVVSFLCGNLQTENKCPSNKSKCESKCSDRSCNVNEAGDSKTDIFNDANFFELIGHENSQIRNLVYHLADKYDLKQTQNVRNEMVMLLKLKEMMDIDESKCCPQSVKSELEFQEYLIQFIQQFCYLGLGWDHFLCVRL